MTPMSLFLNLALSQHLFYNKKHLPMQLHDNTAQRRGNFYTDRVGVKDQHLFVVKWCEVTGQYPGTVKLGGVTDQYPSTDLSAML
jgi:hypothetical protein